MASDSADRNPADTPDLTHHALWLTIVKLRRRLWLPFLMFLLVPFGIAIWGLSRPVLIFSERRLG